MSKIKNQLGFTITELLAVIVIIGIIIGIAVPIYTKIRKNNLETQYKNVTSLIETKAKEYASSNDITITTVDELVKTGYLKADDESGIVKNPVDGTSLNCNIVKITEENGDYTATFTTETSGANNNCSTPIEADKVEIKCNNEKCKNQWYSGNLKLTFNSDNIAELKGANLDSKSVTWTSSTGLNIQNLSYTLDTKGIATIAKYTVTINYQNKVYTGSVTIKEDNEIPSIDSNLSKVDKSTEWSKDNKSYQVVASDLNGSGILGYTQLALNDNNCPTDKSKYSNANGLLSFTDNGTYTYCVMDNVSNINSAKVTINKIDKTAPTFASSAYFNGYSASSATYTDTESGVNDIRYCITQSSSVSSGDGCFTNQANVSYSPSCGSTYYLFTYAIDNVGNVSGVTLNNSVSTAACYVPPAPSYSGGSDYDDERPRYHREEPACDWTCQMHNNSERYLQIDDQAEKDRLHQENIKIAKENCPGCTFDKNKDNYWRDTTDNTLYGVTGKTPKDK